MSMDGADNSRHMDDGEAADVIYAHELFPITEDRVRSHISGCDVCAERLRALRDADRDVGELLSTLDAPPPVPCESAIIRAGRARHHPLVAPAYRRAAAAIAFMTVAAVAAAAIPASPLHRLIVAGLASAQKSPAENVPAVTPQTPAPASPGVFFTPESTLEVVFDRRGTAGVVHARTVDGDQVSLSSLDSGSIYRVSSSRITVDQSPRGDFELSLPRSLRDVRIRIGEELVFERRQGSPTGPDSFTIPLSRPNSNTSNNRGRQ